VDGSLTVDAFAEMIDAEIFGDEKQRRYHTIAGFVMQVLERIPRPADHFDWQGYRFEVMDMDDKRVDKLLITPLASHLPGEDDAEADLDSL
jgi:putative hemolysin